jgi:hypothetical protein
MKTLITLFILAFMVATTSAQEYDGNVKHSRPTTRMKERLELAWFRRSRSDRV